MSDITASKLLATSDKMNTERNTGITLIDVASNYRRALEVTGIVLPEDLEEIQRLEHEITKHKLKFRHLEAELVAMVQKANRLTISGKAEEKLSEAIFFVYRDYLEAL